MRENTNRRVGALLVACVQDQPVDVLIDEVGDAIIDVPAIAAHHGVEAFAYDALLDHDRIPACALDALRDETYRVALIRQQVIADLAELTAAFDAAGITFLVIKGPVLAEAVYEVRGRRSYSDLDVLVSATSLRAAVDALEGSGFRVTDRNWDLLRRIRPGELHLQGPAGTIIDLHWHLLNEPSMRRETRIDGLALFERSRVIEVARMGVPTLDAVDTLVYVALHAALSGGSRLIWVKDVEQSARAMTLNWPCVVDRAIEWRVVPALAVMLARARQTFGLEVPDRVWSGLGGGRRYQQVVEPIARLFPTEREIGRRSPARIVARSCRSTTAASSRELARRSMAWATTKGPRTGEPDWLIRDPLDPRSPDFDAGGDAGREQFFTDIATGRL